ncbi:MAG: huntingtin interacting protein E-like protein [Candidatus Eremiobacteraeota bacterium]|nr:huntingtin interacting protein E-like protein [Candidatus Eremiobacteraeota bacterium]
MAELDERLSRLQSLPANAWAGLVRLFAAEDVRFTWASNALEGNTLTLRETQRVLEDGATIAGKSMREHLEAVNHAAAVRRMHEIAERGEALTVHVMLELHGLLLRGIDDAWAGRIRNDAVAIAGTQYRPPHADAASAGVDDTFARYGERKDRDHPVVVAADLHYETARLHPFFDGNGRTARLLMNAHLLQRFFPPLIIEPNARGAYLDALDAGQETGDASAFRLFIAGAMQQSLEQYAKILSI